MYLSPLAIESIAITMAAALQILPDDALPSSALRMTRYRRFGVAHDAAMQLDGEAVRREKIRRSIFLS